MRLSLKRWASALIVGSAFLVLLPSAAGAATFNAKAFKTGLTPANMRARLLALPPKERAAAGKLLKVAYATVTIKTAGAGQRTTTTTFRVKPGRVAAPPAMLGPTPARTADAGALPPCSSFSHSITFTWTAHNFLGDVVFEYHSYWYWAGMCWVHAAQHHEWGDHTNWYYSYQNSLYGSAYGSLNSPMVGRETFGYFNYAPPVIPGYQSVVQMQVKVYGVYGNCCSYSRSSHVWTGAKPSGYWMYYQQIN